IVGAVGMLQFDVMVHRLENEYGAPCTLEMMPYRFPRWVTGSEDAIRRLGEAQDLTLLRDSKENFVLVFRDEWRLRWATDKATEQGLAFHTEAP
ncbi:MAG: peptide chain release factor 3, partial [Gemmatimonas sp.]|nr:peptide chain release factor 3 [Gemmatimonas sp.]